MPVTLSVTDQQNGGGVVAAVTGTGTITVEAYVAGTGWEVIGSRSGDGNVSGTASELGLLWFIAKTSTEVSAVVPVYVARDAQAVYDKCLQAVRDTIQAIVDGDGLNGVNGVFRQRKPRLDAIEYNQPCIVVTPGSPTMQPITSGTDEVVFPCVAMLFNTESEKADDDEDASIPYYLIQQRLCRLFSQQRLTGVTEISVTNVVINNVFEWQREYEQLKMAITVNCVARRQPRGA